MSRGTLKLRREKPGGQVEGVISIPSVQWYVEVFGSKAEALAFAERWELELIEPGEADAVPEMPPENGGRRQS